MQPTDRSSEIKSAVSWFEPAWWTALILLVLNDHVLKHAGLLPGWLTGKLSDFAGLVVAPVLMATLARTRTRSVRAICFGLVAAWFCAIKLSLPAARAMEVAIGWTGISWRLWCDPTDLIALAVLPFSWRVSYARPVRGRLWTRQRSRRVLGVILGAAACLATSPAVPIGFRTSAYLANMTLDPLEVRVYRARGPLDCAQIATTPPGALALLQFDPERCKSLGPGRVLPLDRNWSTLAVQKSDGGAPLADPPCDAVIVRVADLPDTLLVWQQLDDVDVEDPVSGDGLDKLDPHGIYLERAGERIFAAGSPFIAATTSTLALPDMNCGAFSIPDAGGASAASADGGAGQ